MGSFLSSIFYREKKKEEAKLVFIRPRDPGYVDYWLDVIGEVDRELEKEEFMSRSDGDGKVKVEKNAAWWWWSLRD